LETSPSNKKEELKMIDQLLKEIDELYKPWTDKTMKKEYDFLPKRYFKILKDDIYHKVMTITNALYSRRYELEPPKITRKEKDEDQDTIPMVDIDYKF